MTKRANNEGSIYHRANGSWQAQVTLDGKRLSRTSKNRKEVQAWLKETLQQVEQGLTLDGAKTSLGELLDTWFEMKKSNLRLSTQALYGNMIRVYLKPSLGDIKLKDLNAARIQALYSQLLKDGKGRRTIEVVHMVLHSCLDHALHLSLVVSNWADRVAVPRPEKREMQVWSESQVNQFLTFIPAQVREEMQLQLDGGRGKNRTITQEESEYLIHSYQTFYRLVFATGMRRAEIIGLKWEDIDWSTSSIVVRRQVYQLHGGGFRFQEPKTARGRRSVRLGPGLIEALRIQLNQALPLARQLAGSRWEENNLIFPTSNGTPKDGNNVRHQFHRLVELSGLPAIRFHDIRHTAASILLLHGEPPVRVAGILGQTVAVLLDTYAHWVPDDQSTASELMDQVTSPTFIDLSGRSRVAAGKEVSS